MADDPKDNTPELADNPLLKQPGPGRGPGRPFQKGQSGNPAGRPPGSHNKLRAAIQQAIEEHAAALVDKALQLAFGGNLQAIKLLFSQLPPEREQIEIELPKISSMTDIVAANEALFIAIGQGRLSPESAKLVAEIIASQMRALEGVDFERRVALLEAKYAEAESLKKRGQS